MQFGNYLKTANRLLIDGLRSQWFFYATLLFFVFSASWIALSNSFPLHFDENYHLGVIDIYANHSNPFSDTQPDEAKYYGDITTLNSYLYHFLMSFPYQLLGWLTDSVESKIIALRLMNVLMVAGSLILWRRLLLDIGISKSIAQLSILAFVALPIVPLLAAHINYDNLTLLLLPLLLIIANQVFKRQNFLIPLLLLVGLSCVAVLVKFTMLPVVAVLTLAVVGWLVYVHRSKLARVLDDQIRKTPIVPLVLVALVAGFGVGLVGERYIGNIVQYGSISPSCQVVQDESVCSHFSVWVRNTAATERAEDLDRSALWNPFEYSYNRWVPHIFNDLFVIASFENPEINIHQPMPTGLQASAGSPVFRIVAWVMFGLAVIALLLGFRYLPRHKLVWIIASATVVYAGALWWQNYTGYLAVGQPYATQGRYLVPFIIPFVALSCVAMRGLLVRVKLPYAPSLMVVGLLITMLLGAGGVATYVVYSQSSWQWDVGYFREWNSYLRDVLNPLLAW